jgi:hypothetical protein
MGSVAGNRWGLEPAAHGGCEVLVFLFDDVAHAEALAVMTVMETRRSQSDSRDGKHRTRYGDLHVGECPCDKSLPSTSGAKRHPELRRTQPSFFGKS